MKCLNEIFAISPLRTFVQSFVSLCGKDKSFKHKGSQRKALSNTKDHLSIYDGQIGKKMNFYIKYIQYEF
jgi:hypothetical protein